MKANGTNNKKIKLNAGQISVIDKKFNSFKQNYKEEQEKFHSSKQQKYYIVSTKYIEEWAQFCESKSEQRELPSPMNHDLFDAGGQMRKGLLENQDFEILNQKIYNIIKLDGEIEIVRTAYTVGKDKIVPIYLEVLRYIKLDSKDIYDIDRNRVEQKDMQLKGIQIAQQQTVYNLKQRIRNQEQITHKHETRIWKVGSDVSIQDLYDIIKKQTKPQTSSYKVSGQGKLIEDEDTKISDLSIKDGQYFILEVADEYRTWFFKQKDQAKCEGCYKYKKLPFPCPCKKVAYCTENCMQNDKRYHLRDCKYAEEMQFNQQIDMTIRSNSSLGKVGLTNLGNTCFMNSCLQCMSNTVPLTRYFIQKYYEKEINKDNVLGYQGKLAKNYARFIKGMWCDSSDVFSPHQVKSTVAKKNANFSGYAQQDSQQFFSFLVDGIHEDLNRIKKKPYVQSVQSKNRSDQIVALESWVAYTQRNQSIIVDLMTGQYKSKVICPTCNLQSITFDPFTTVSLPIPEEATPQTLKFYVIQNNNCSKPLKISFQYTKADVKQWLETATKYLKRNPEDFMFYMLTMNENIYNFETTSKNQILYKNDVQSKNIFLIELSEEQRKLRNQQKFEVAFKFCKPTYSQSSFDNLWFKRPFFFGKKANVKNIFERVVQYIYSIYSKKEKYSFDEFVSKVISEKHFSLVIKYKKSIERFYNRVQTKFDKQVNLDDMQIKLQEIFQKLDISDSQIDVRFTRDSYKLYDFDKWKDVQNFEIKQKNNKDDSRDSKEVTLDQCFRVFEEQQTLEPGNQWYCPRCKQHRLATKEMTIYKAPQIMIIHLKRFKSKGILRKQKNQTNVKFPMELNMAQYLIDPTPIWTYNEELKKINKYVEPAFSAKVQKNSSPDYELYAISNHYGGLGGGHYTAYGKNNDKWYQFNDSSVRSVSSEMIKGSGAYMLFYKRKNGIVF